LVESETSPEQVFAGVDPAHRDELIALWKSGQVTLLDKLADTPDLPSRYVIRFDFQDGTSYTTKINEHPNPPVREEWRQIRDAGGGELVSLRRLPSGMVGYIVRYVLSDGETLQYFDGLPPMSKAQRTAAYEYVTQQLESGAGTIVGSSTDMAIVEVTLPDGSPFTQFVRQPYPRAELTAARQDEISEMIALGKGDFKEQLFSEQGSGYVVEFTLSDGSFFRMGHCRPVMTDAQWDAARAEAAALYAAGQYTRETVTGVGGQPVEVLVMTLSTGYVAKIGDVAEIRQLWGIE
jgi:hypothetical protein